MARGVELNKLKIVKDKTLEEKVKQAEGEIGEYIRRTHKDVVALRKFAAKSKWTEIRFATVCQACIEAFQNAAPSDKVPSLRALIQEMNKPATQGEVN